TACAIPAGAQQSQSAGDRSGRIGLPIDWSTRHIIHSDLVNDDFAAVARHEPRIMFSWLQRNNARNRSALNNAAGARQAQPKKSSIKRDWNFTLGSGTVAPNQYPAKFGFDVNATPSCANDFAIFGLNIAGVTSGAGTAQPNLVGFNNLYTGTG